MSMQFQVCSQAQRFRCAYNLIVHPQSKVCLNAYMRAQATHFWGQVPPLHLWQMLKAHAIFAVVLAAWHSIDSASHLQSFIFLSVPPTVELNTFCCMVFCTATSFTTCMSGISSTSMINLGAYGLITLRISIFPSNSKAQSESSVVCLFYTTWSHHFNWKLCPLNGSWFCTHFLHSYARYRSIMVETRMDQNIYKVIFRLLMMG